MSFCFYLFLRRLLSTPVLLLVDREASFSDGFERFFPPLAVAVSVGFGSFSCTLFFLFRFRLRLLSSVTGALKTILSLAFISDLTGTWSVASGVSPFLFSVGSDL